jgi:hypothetical protein
MNERIYELAVETGIIKEEEGYYWIQSVDTLEKFAELLIRECMEVTVNYPHPQTKLAASEHIARHFGVKE